MIDVVARIGELMSELGLSAYELSNITNISANAIYDWFKADATPALSTIAKMCDTLGISLEYFFCGKPCLDERDCRALKKWLALSDTQKRAVVNLMRAFNGK